MRRLLCPLAALLIFARDAPRPEQAATVEVPWLLPDGGAVDAAPVLDAAPDAAPDAMPDAAPADAAPVDAALDPNRPAIFRAGCPRPGASFARLIEDADAHLEGPDAIGGAGDYLLANDRAAFIISGAGPVKTYFYYPGIPIDAVALDGCQQAGPERFEEIGWLAARPDIARFTYSKLRAFHGVRWEVINDGRDGGEARVRVEGVDDMQWLTENELRRQVFESGGARPPPEPLGVALSVDYVLPPDQPVLRIEYTVRNLADAPATVTTLAMAQFGDTAPTTYFVDTTVRAASFTARTGLPFIGSRAADGGWGIAREGPLSTAHFSGVDAVFDFAQMAAPIVLSPAGGRGSETTAIWYLATGRSLNDVAASLHAVNPRALRNGAYELAPLSGQVVDAAGAPIADAVVDVLLENHDGDWARLDDLHVDAEGRFVGQEPALGAPLRVRANAPGRASVEVEIDSPQADLRLEMGPVGHLIHRVVDEDDVVMPAKIELWQGNSMALRAHVRPFEGTLAVTPGHYQAVVTRGFEYALHSEEIDVPPDGEVRLDVRLPRLLDTAGWLSTDGHMHGGPSPDSNVSIADRMTISAATGLEVAMGTDHEIVRDWRVGIPEAGLGPFINAVGGQEVTATLPEHMGAWPMAPLPVEEDPRGGPVAWYGLTLGGVFAAIRARGAGVVQLNHPRQGCNYMCLIDWDRLTGEPRLQDPTRLGFAPDDELWSWDFDAVELINGIRTPFVDPASPNDTGTFEDWATFHNLGHRVTAMANSDVHGDDSGNPMNWFAAPTDAPAEFVPQMLTDAVRGGRSVITLGAFINASIGEAGLGDTVQANDGTVTLSLRVQAVPEVDVRQIVVYANCDQVALLDATDPGGVVKFAGDVELDLPADAWLVVAAFGRDRMPRGFLDYDPRRIPRSLTNAIFVDVDGNGRFDPPGAKTCRYDVPAP